MVSRLPYPSAIGLVGLLVVGSLGSQLEAAVRGAAGWARLESLEPGKSARVVLSKAAAPPGLRKIKGVFHSSTESSVTIVLKSG